MAAIRSFWRGHLRLARVVVPVRLVTATDPAAAIHFHQVHRESGQRIRHAKIAPGVGEVGKEEIVYGYEIEPDNFVLLEKEDLEAVRLDTRRTIEIIEFVADGEIDPIHYDKPYYLLPDGAIAQEAYAVLREALKAEGKSAVGKLVLRGRESLIALRPVGRGMLLETLRFAREIKDAEAVFSGVSEARPRTDLVNAARQLIDGRTVSFDPARYADHYAEALDEMVREKLKFGRVVAPETAAERVETGDFPSALRQSLKQQAARKPRVLPAPENAGTEPQRSRHRA